MDSIYVEVVIVENAADLAVRADFARLLVVAQAEDEPAIAGRRGGALGQVARGLAVRVGPRQRIVTSNQHGFVRIGASGWPDGAGRTGGKAGRFEKPLEFDAHS